MQRVIVVGGGTFGLSSAYALRIRGHQVTVIDRLPIPAEDAASTDLNKVVRSDYGTDILYQELALKSIETFKQWNKDCQNRFGHILYHEVGVAYLTNDPNMNEFEIQSLEALRVHGGPEVERKIEFVNTPSPNYSGKAIGERWPGLQTAVKKLPGGYINHGGGFGDSGRTIAYLARLAADAGVNFIMAQFDSVVYHDADSKRAKGVKTRDGSIYAADIVLIAAGSWTPALLPELRGKCVAVGQPVVQFRPQFEPVDPKTVTPVWFADVSMSGFYGFPRAARDGRTIKVANHGPGYLPRSFDFHKSGKVTPTSIPVKAVYEFRLFFDKMFPWLNEEDIVATRLCWYCDSWDSNFFIDAVPGKSGLFVASGGSGHAFKFTPVIGEVVADVIEDKPSKFRHMFKWREPPTDKSLIKNSDPVRDQNGADPGILEDEVMALPEDLAAEAFKSGRLREKVESLGQKSAKL